jgi:hypothetical protein
MRGQSAMTEENDDKVAKRAAWLKEAASFLKDKTMHDLLEYYRLSIQLEFGDNNKDYFASAMHEVFWGNPARALEMAKLLLDDDPNLHYEAYWVLHDIALSDPEAIKLIFDQLLSDPDDGVFESVYDIVDEMFFDADISFENMMYMGGKLLIAKKRHQA